MIRLRFGALSLLLAAATPALAAPDAAAIRAALADPNGRLLIAAHRGCHNPAPGHGLSSAPEISLLALDH